MAYRSLVSSKYFIHFLTYLLATRRLQITHCALHVTVTKPLLYGSQINASPQAPSCERRTKFVQPEVLFLETRTFSDAFQTIKEIELRTTSPSRKDQATGLVGLCLVRLQARDEPRRNWDFPLSIILRAESILRFIAHGDRRPCEIQIVPRAMRHFLFTHPRHQKEFVPRSLLLVANGEQRVQFLTFVNFRFFLHESRPVILAHQSANALCLQERHHVLEFVVDAPWRLFLHVPQKCRELENVLPFDVVEIEFRAGFLEVFQSSLGPGGADRAGDK